MCARATHWKSHNKPQRAVEEATQPTLSRPHLWASACVARAPPSSSLRLFSFSSSFRPLSHYGQIRHFAAFLFACCCFPTFAFSRLPPPPPRLRAAHRHDRGEHRTFQHQRRTLATSRAATQPSPPPPPTKTQTNTRRRQDVEASRLLLLHTTPQRIFTFPLLFFFLCSFSRVGGTDRAALPTA